MASSEGVSFNDLFGLLQANLSARQSEMKEHVYTPGAYGPVRLYY
jgi:hypothetical protein